MSLSRRDLLGLIGTSAVAAQAHPLIGAVQGKAEARILDSSPIGGYVNKIPKSYLFTDHRLIYPGDIRWRGRDGVELPTGNPVEPPVPVVPDLSTVPYGVRMVAKPARTEAIVEDQQNPPGLGMIYESGKYFDLAMHQLDPISSKVESTRVEFTLHESDDGLHWRQKSKSDVVVVPGGMRSDGNGWFIDHHRPDSERYKVIYMAYLPPSQVESAWKQFTQLHPRYRDNRMHPDLKLTGVYGLTSPDGINWTVIPEPLMVNFMDSDTTVLFDEWLGKYVMYTRLYPTMRRVIGISESDDFRHWNGVRPLVWPRLSEHFSTDIYLNCRTYYPDMPKVHLMFPTFYRRLDQTSEVRMYSSLDGLNWDEVPGGPVLTPEIIGHGAQFIGPGKNLVPLGKDKVGMAFFGTCYPHKYPRWQKVNAANVHGLCWWQKGRLSAMTADEQGEFCTFPVKAMGRGIRINARTPDAGMIKVGLLDPEGVTSQMTGHLYPKDGLRDRAGRTVADCDPIIGDRFEHKVTWKGSTDTGVMPGKEVALKFYLSRAEVYGFEWVD